MAYREIAMWEIWEVLRRVHRGEGQRAIQRVTGHGRATIRRWVACATELGWVPLVQVPDEAMARQVAERMQPIAVSRAPGESELQLALHRERIRAWLASDASGRGLRLSKVHQLLARPGAAIPDSSL